MNKITTTPIPAMLKEAVALHQAGKLDAAQPLYQQILLIQPDHFDAMHFLGVIARQRGHAVDSIKMISHAITTLNGPLNKNHASAFCNLGTAHQDNREPELAMKCYMQAIELKPDYAIAHNNLGNALKNLNRMQDALQSFQNALACSPNYAEAYFNAGLVVHEARQFDSALQCFNRAIQIKPGYAEAYFARGNVYLELHMIEQALDEFDLAILHKPDYAKAWLNRGIVLNRLTHYPDAQHSFESAIQYQERYANAFFYLASTLKFQKKIPEAIAAYQQAMEYGADAEQVNFSLAALGVGTAPDAAPKEYIRDLFDQYASHFDQHLLAVLNYDVPQQLARLIEKYRQSEGLSTIDLGCGTGLCANYLRPFSASLAGVDLSQKMLDKAAQLNLYDDLICAELTAFLRGYAQAADLIVAADVLVYFGDLHPLFDAVQHVLNDLAYFCFSVEAAELDQSPFVLRDSSRYAHSESYLRNLAQQCGLKVIEIIEHNGRMENQQHVKALHVMLQKVATTNER